MTCQNQLPLSPRIFSQTKVSLGGRGPGSMGRQMSIPFSQKVNLITPFWLNAFRGLIIIKHQTYHYNVEDLSSYSFSLCFHIQHSPFPTSHTHTHTHTHTWSLRNNALVSVLWVKNTFSRIHRLLSFSFTLCLSMHYDSFLRLSFMFSFCF